MTPADLAAQWGDSVRYWLRAVEFWLSEAREDMARECEANLLRCARLAGHYGRLALKGRDR